MCRRTNIAIESQFIHSILLLHCQWGSMAPWSYSLLFCVIHITEYLITYSMEQSPPLQTDLFCTSQEIPRILWNPNAHYRIHNCPLPVTVLSQKNPVHAPITNVLKIHPNILPSMFGSSKWSLSIRFPHQKPLCTPLLSHMEHVTHPNNIWWGVQIIKLLICSFFLSPVPCPSYAKIFFSAPYSQTTSGYVPPSMWANSFHTHTCTKQQTQ